MPTSNIKLDRKRARTEAAPVAPADTGVTGGGDTVIDTAGTDTGSVETDTVETGGNETGIVDTGERVVVPPEVTTFPTQLTVFANVGNTFSIFLYGRADPLEITCPEWVSVLDAPQAFDGEMRLMVTSVPGFEAGLEGECLFGNAAVPIRLVEA